MPRIPDFNVPSVQVQPIQMPEMQGPGVAPMPNAAPQQIQEMGQGMSRFGEGMSNIAMRMQDMVNDSVVAETDNKWRDILNQESVRFHSLQGRDAITGYNSFQENLAKQRREIETGLTNPAQKIAFRGAADRRMMDVDKQANFHVMRESYNFKVKETESRISNMFDDAISFGSRVYDPGTPLSVKLLDGSGLISDKTAAAITMGAKASRAITTRAKQDNLDAFQTRFSGLMNQAKEHLSFQGINPDDEQGKLYMKNLERGVYTGVLQRMLQGNDVDSARMFLADKNNKSKVDPKMLYDVETTLAKERKSQMSDNIARAVFMRDDLPTVEDKKNFVMGAFTAGHIDQKDLKSTFETIESLAKDEDESFKKRQNQALDLAKTKIRAATGGLGFQASDSAGNALLSMDRNLYMQLGEDGVTKLEDWARTNYQEKTNPAHRNQLLDMMQNRPELFAGLTETELRYSYQLSKEDEDLFIARIKDRNNTATPEQRQIKSDNDLLIQQYRKENPNYQSMDSTQIEKTPHFSEWHDKIQRGYNQFKNDKSNANKNLFDFFQTRDNTKVVVDGKEKALFTLPEGETGGFRVQIPNTNRTVDVLPGDIPTWERATVVEAIQNANRNPYRVYKLEQDENGVQKLVLHKRANGETAMHSSVSEAMAEAQSLGEGFTVQKGEIVSEDEQSIATHWVRNIAKPGVDVERQVGLVRRRADLGERLKTQGVASLDEYAQKILDSSAETFSINSIIQGLNLEDQIPLLLTTGKFSETTTTVQPKDYKREFSSTVRNFYWNGSPSLSKQGAFEFLNQVANNMGMEISPELNERLGQSLKDNNFPASTSGANARAQLANITAEQRKKMVAETRSAMFRRGSYEWHVANTPFDAFYGMYGPYVRGDSKKSDATDTTKAPSPLGASLIEELSREIASERMTLQIQNLSDPKAISPSPYQHASSDNIKKLERMIELINGGDYSAAEQWRSKKDTMEKAYKSVFPNGLPK